MLRVSEFEKEIARELEWGVVEVIGGRFKGAVGYYDDDDGSRGIVYFEHPINVGPYVMIPRRLLRQAPRAVALAWHLKYDPPANDNGFGCYEEKPPRS